MLNKNKKIRVFTRRIFVLGALNASLFLSLIARLYYLQIVKSKEYKTFSDSNRIKMVLIPPLRGKIYGRSGELLASNKNFYRILFDPEFSDKNDLVIDKLSQILNFDEAQKQSLADKINKQNSRQTITVHEHLSWKEVAKVEANAPDLPGISIDVGQIRDFTTGAISSHVVGYMGPVSEKEIKANNLLNHPDFKIGRYGIEKSLEQTLRGNAGVKRMEVNAYGLTIRELSREESKPGKDVKLTLHRKIQEFAGERMKGLSGCSIIMDIKNGDIVSFVSSPGFNPNEFTYGVSQEYWNELNSNPKKPLINKGISNQYPPGSTFKLVVALAALKDGVNPNKTIYCPGYVDLGRTRFHCWKEEGHGHMDMKSAIMHSCNSYFYNISKKIGVDNIAEMARKFGLGETLQNVLSNEKTGLVPSRKWKKDKYGVEWQQGDTLNVGIGQGYVLATPLQLVTMVARVASGTAVKPYLLYEEQHKEGFETFKELDIPQKHLDLVREGMRRVINIPGGTAYGSRIRNSKYTMAGKTGTSQVISKKGLKDNIKNMTPEEIAMTKNHALFVGYSSVSDPKYAISVVIEHGGGGSAAAAPVARDILLETQKIMDV